jgi:putative hemolysin
MSWLLIIFIIALLIFLNALYVAAEFSAVSARRARLTQLAEGGQPIASRLLDIIEHPYKLDRYVATCQLGITVTSLILGFYGQATLSPLVVPYLVQYGRMAEVAALSLSATIVLLVLTVAQVLLGELVPKNIGIQYPERLALLTTLPMRWSMFFFRPLIWMLNGSGQALMRLFGKDILAEHAHIHSPDEILMLVNESTEGGLLQKEERQLLKNTLELREAMVRQVMNCSNTWLTRLFRVCRCTGGILITLLGLFT